MTSDKPNIKDKKILYQLDLNSRQPNSKIAKKVGLSKDIVNYRIKKLEQANFIRGYYTVIDFSRLSYFSVRVYLKLFDTSPKKEKELTNFLINHQKVFYVAEIEGSFDLNFSLLVKNIYEFEDFYLEFKKKFKPYLGQEQISIFTKAYHFHRAYLLDKKFDNAKPETFGREKTQPHDQLDLNILKLLAQNARLPLLELSQKLKTSPRTLAFRIKQLEKKKIIQGYRFIFDFNLFGYEYYKVDLILKDLSRKKEFLNFAHAHPNIIYVDETLAGSDFEFDIELKSKEDFSKFIKELRTSFPEIRSWSYFTLTRYHKLLYFPEI